MNKQRKKQKHTLKYGELPGNCQRDMGGGMGKTKGLRGIHFHI